MIISVLIIPKENDKRLAELFKDVHANIDKATEKDVEDYQANEGKDETLDLKEAIEDWHSIVTAVEKDLPSRLVDYFYHNDEVIYMTGGLSWGDLSDEQNDFSHFSNLPNWITAPVTGVTEDAPANPNEHD